MGISDKLAKKLQKFTAELIIEEMKENNCSTSDAVSSVVAGHITSAFATAVLLSEFERNACYNAIYLYAKSKMTRPPLEGGPIGSNSETADVASSIAQLLMRVWNKENKK